ncbi:MAG: hypothetical protein HN352_05230 [Bacteroidetes bacterium]|jgi:hypothetical protein|nr:hypothetical protein [Bacteroidota bacterium]MBT3751569.1 hypothetical protein [Bacteroidota bacterium]MBT4401645.1 hypothetical protein [Bacteroidota bacterium]MBT4408520.1 hypothetical protein [Bacteroidota bacterium]MBT5425973.1 hypothetical protein [Bacteroidota bacterium]
MRIIKLFSLLSVSMFFSAIVSIGQEVTVKSSIDTTQILIGDQVNILLEIDQPKEKNLAFPVFKDTLVKMLEVLNVSGIDTVQANDGRIQLRQRLLVTSFDTGFYIIPSFYFVDQETRDSFRTEALPLEVFTLEIDTTKGITDIKLPYDVPLTFLDILPYIIVGLLLIGLIILILYIRHKRKQKPEPVAVRVKPAEPAHLWALRSLDALVNEKLWQKGKIKLYHSRISEIIRFYIEYRFNTPAMEQITSEILIACEKNDSISDELTHKLGELLELSDLVKFAKWAPVPDENERSLEIAYDFVLKTKQIINLRSSESTETNNTQSEMDNKKEGKNG